MMHMIYDKSDKGRQEISTRKFRLAPKLRALLVLVDGKHSGEALVRKFAYLGMNETFVAELVDNGYIQGTLPIVREAPAAPEIGADAADANKVPGPENQHIPDGILEPGETQFQAVYHFYTHTIKSVLGLRGYLMQLKVERCNSIEDFRALRLPYVEAVAKAQGEDMARSLGSRLYQLLYLEQTMGVTVPAREQA